MKALQLNKNVINTQKCLFSDSEFCKENHLRYIRICYENYDIVNKVGLCQFPNIQGCVFLDRSVIVPKKSLLRSQDDKLYVHLKQIKCLSDPEDAKVISVTVVYSNVENTITDQRLLRIVIKDILKFYVFVKDSFVFLHNLTECQRAFIFGVKIEVDNAKEDCSYKVTNSTMVNVKSCVSLLKLQQTEKLSLLKNVPIGGSKTVIKSLMEILRFNKVENKFKKRNILVVGPGASGKTSMVLNAVTATGYVVINLNCTNITESLPGESEKQLKHVFQRAKLHQAMGEDCIVFMKQVESVCVKGSDGSSHARRVLQQLLTLLRESKVTVVATSSMPEDIDERLKTAGHFDEILEVFFPTNHERCDILEKLLEHYNVNCPDGLAAEVAQWTPGYVGGDLQMLIQEVVRLKSKGAVTLEDCFKKVVSATSPSAFRGALGLLTSTSTETFADIGGLTAVKSTLNYSVKLPLFHPEAFARFGISPTKGILLYGPPGCAKTSLVRALANETKSTFLSVSAADLYSPFVGDAEARICKLFHQARMGAPSIIFIDEIDALVGSKSGARERGVQERVLSALLVEMDGVGIKTLTGVETRSKQLVVIGATNRPGMLDDALKRPGRFNKLVYVPPPDRTDRLDILRTITQKMPLAECVNLEYIAAVTEHYSGADLRNLCTESGLHALSLGGIDATQINQDHFDAILATYKPLLNHETLKLYQQI